VADPRDYGNESSGPDRRSTISRPDEQLSAPRAEPHSMMLLK
jgi:hypothetical protein